MSEPVEVQIVIPPTASARIDVDLVSLTEHIWKTFHAGEEYGYGLGGEFGYGVEFSNAVFAMFPFYWGECECGWDAKAATLDDLAHDPDCYQTELEARRLAAGLGYDQDTWLPRTPGLAYDETRVREDALYRELTGKYGLSMHGCAVHCTCSWKARWQVQFDAAKLGPEGHAESCPTVRPNFLHKPTGLQIDWYKWIGRDMEYRPKPSAREWRRVFAECVASVG